MSMAISEFPEWLYAIAYMDISSNYPDICPQKMGIKVGCWGIEKSGKIEILIILQPILLAKSDKSA